MRILNKLREPFNIVALSSLVLGILTLFDLGPIKTILTTIFLILIILILFYIVYFAVEWYYARSKWILYKNWKDEPKRYQIQGTLEYLAKNLARIEIIARTCFRWLCGDENLYKSDPLKFREHQKELQGMIIEAIKHGSAFNFILQNPNIPIPYFSEEENKLLHEHAIESIKSYHDLKSLLTDIEKERIKLSFTNEVIDNSMLRIIKNEKVIRLVIDLSIKFKSPDLEKTEISKPVLIIESKKEDIQEYAHGFKYILENAISEEKYSKELSKAKKNITALLDQYPHFSLLRNDTAVNLAKKLSDHFLFEKNAFKSRVPPPVSIQLLVTNGCTTRCVMCDHYKLYEKNKLKELDEEEIKCVLESIKKLGTNAVVISGGEPLFRQDIFEILQFGKQIGLNIGLLTNGIKYDNTALTKEEANKIAKTCSWVQFSLDSFNESTYQKIRREGSFSSAMESLKMLINSGIKIEICSTIQKHNINEIRAPHDSIFNQVPIRLKFAHGPTNSSKDFLCSESEIKDFIHKADPSSERVNFTYLLNMIDNEYFDFEGLASGMPLKGKMMQYKNEEYKCLVLRMTCKIDPQGDVYPCCFLFDDNNANSEIRNKYKIGSLRSRSGRVLPLLDKTESALEKIWKENLKERHFRNLILPIDNEACNYCTRHFYQNEFLNILWLKLLEYFKFGFYQDIYSEFENRQNESSIFWL